MMAVNKTKKIVLIDEDEEFSTQAKKAIEHDNNHIEIIVLDSKENALEKIKESNLHGIISNYNLGNRDGLELLKKIRIGRQLNIPFILLMDRVDSKTRLKALKLDANRVFHKKKNLELSCQILKEIIKQELLDYKTKKELEHHRKREIHMVGL